ncbi:serine phosphatase RsbU (regulator of sigma subunit) [Hamadaea flava]|uniref:PP2C family protein-serine/threonine phosphatase n=1 Tax=Hamadaea flava TaxID=1742688 RepID=A0ABV8LES8_9ACTN|nr:PP2C family protein-serine/threonine phosphatase [Hamadaea flava]MCP2326142.1 serine phosphatase RsbU (regulator of sigma subunit) [Hamadaea flava]
MLIAVLERLLWSSRRPLTPGTRAGVGAAAILLFFLAILEWADGPEPHYIGLMATAPFLAAAFAPWRSVLVAGGLATALGTVFAVMSGARGQTTLLNVIGIGLATGLAAAAAAVRQKQAERIAELSHLAMIAQQAVLRPLGPTVGGLSIAGRYISATAAADIGGDLFEAVETAYGVRIIVGDVRGKGLDAVRLASIVLGSYRHVAYDRADLRAIVADLDRAVARSVGEEDFVTAVLVEERGGTLTVVNCGHPAPLLLRRGNVIPLEPPAPAPPLGFLPSVKARVERLEPGDRLLIFTDGLAEARRDGRFFPIAERAWRLLGHGTVGDGLASIETALVEWVHGRLDDDIALVLLEYTGPQSGGPMPSWEVGTAPSVSARSALEEGGSPPRTPSPGPHPDRPDAGPIQPSGPRSTRTA